MIPLNRNLSGLRRSAIRVYTNLANATPGCVKLTLGEPDMPTPATIRSAASAALEAGQTHYAPNQGTSELRRAISEYETARGNAVTENQVLVTIGATQALYTALTGILNPGEEVVIPTPGFVLYESIVLAAGGRPVFLDVSKTDFQITGEALAALITPKTKAIVLNSPNNPTGVVLNGESIAAVKRAVLGKPIFVICDNVYNLLCDGDAPDLSTDPECAGQTLVCQSFSKPWAMTGWRVGYLTAPAYVMDRLLLLSAAEIASVPTFVQAAAVEALRTDPGPLADTFRQRREYVTGRLKSMGLPFPEPRGAFYVFPDIRQFGMTSDEFCTRMIREAGVAAVPGSCFGLEGYIRLSCCCSDENLREGLDRMERFLATLPHCAR